MMYISTIVVTALLDAYIAMAEPASQHETRQATLCSGLEDVPLCCAVNLLGIADLDCRARKYPLFAYQILFRKRSSLMDGLNV